MVGVSEGPDGCELGPMPSFDNGVQVAGMLTGVGVLEGKIIPTGRVGGGNGLKGETGLAKMETTIMATINRLINAIIERASQTENFMKLPAFPSDLPKKMLLMSV